MRFVAPPREAVDAAVFVRPPLSHWREFDALLHSREWPSIADLEGLRSEVQKSAKNTLPHFVEQTPQLLCDGLHYETRIAERGLIATRERNWHDLLNALIWLRYPAVKSALNARQVAEIAMVGNKQRSRAQYALTHFDEAGTIVQLSDPVLLKLWDAHDWHGLFWRERDAWSDGRIRVDVFGHALLEHALKPEVLFVGKSVAIATQDNSKSVLADVAAAIHSGELLGDPQDLRPLPLCGIPGWHPSNGSETFYSGTPCFRPLRDGRRYPPMVHFPS